MLTRRELLSTVGAAALASVASPKLVIAAQTPAASGPYTLAALPYPATALEPHIDAQTMTIHHDRHHQTYVASLNAALAKEPAVAGRSLDDLLKNHGGGHYNHMQFWTLMAPNAGGAPTGAAAAGPGSVMTKANSSFTAPRIRTRHWPKDASPSSVSMSGSTRTTSRPSGM